MGTERDCPPQSFDWGHSSVNSSQSSDFGGSVTGLASWDLINGIGLQPIRAHIYTFYNFEAVSVRFQFHLHMTSVGFRGAGHPNKSIIKIVPFHFKTMICAHIYTHILTYYGMCVQCCVHTCWNIIKQLLNSKGDAGLPGKFFDWWRSNYNRNL